MTTNPTIFGQLHNVLSDLREPGALWEIAALGCCLLAAALFARRWRSHPMADSRLNGAGARLAFPLTGAFFAGIALLLLKPFFSVNLLKLALVLLAAMALVRVVVYVLRQVFPRATWLAAWERIIATLVWSWMALYLTDLAPRLIDSLEQVGVKLGGQEINLWMILHGLVTVLLTIVAALWLAAVLERRLMGLNTLDANLRIVGVRVIKALLTVIALLASLSLVGINITALSVFTGALGVGLGLGLQKIASNYVSGFIILLDRSVRIGNIIQVGTDAGEVTRITTRYTVLRHPGGAEFIVPNEALIANTVQNQTYSDNRLRLATSIGVAYGTDLEFAMGLMKAVAETHPRVIAEPPPNVLLTQFADSAITLELGFWIADPEAGRGNVVSDINLGIWKAFCDHQVSVPFPQREIRIINPASTAVPANNEKNQKNA